jgi:hypothetical protein
VTTIGIKAASWPSRPWPATIVDQRHAHKVDLPKGGLANPAVLLSFSGLFDFPQYLANFSRHTIYTACTIRIIL